MVQNGKTQNGVYTITMGDTDDLVYCDMLTDGGGWLVVLRRKDGSVNFDRSLKGYKFPFGHRVGEFWLGLINLIRVTNEKQHQLRVEIEDWEGNTTFAKYDIFRVRSRTVNFTVSISGYSGTAGDALSSANDMPFTTRDADNDKNADGNCAALNMGG